MSVSSLAPVKRSSSSLRDIFSLKRVMYLFYAVALLWVAVCAQSVTDYILSRPVDGPVWFTGYASPQLTESCLELSCYLPEQYLSTTDRTGLLTYLAEGIGIHPTSEATHNGTGSFEAYSLLHTGAYAETLLQAISLYGESTQNILRVRLRIYEDVERDVLHYRSRLVSLLDAIGVSHVETSLQFSGRCYGRLTEQATAQLADAAMEDFGAAVTCTYQDENRYVQYGYSAKINEYIVSEGMRVNLEAGYYYDAASNTTRIVLATPYFIR